MHSHCTSLCLSCTISRSQAPASETVKTCIKIVSGYQGVIRIGVTEQATDGEEDFCHCECWRPLRAQDVEADCPVAVDVGVVYAGGECKFRGFEWIVRGEVNVEEKHPTLKRGICRAKNGGLRMFLNQENFWRGEQPTCQWKGSSPTGPALHCAGGSLAMSFNSLLILFRAIPSGCGFKWGWEKGEVEH